MTVIVFTDDLLKALTNKNNSTKFSFTGGQVDYIIYTFLPLTVSNNYNII
jgi:hypothetical protein